jgi:hypothetical protein
MFIHRANPFSTHKRPDPIQMPLNQIYLLILKRSSRITENATITLTLLQVTMKVVTEKIAAYDLVPYLYHRHFCKTQKCEKCAELPDLLFISLLNESQIEHITDNTIQLTRAGCPDHLSQQA